MSVVAHAFISSHSPVHAMKLTSLRFEREERVRCIVLPSVSTGQDPQEMKRKKKVIQDEEQLNILLIADQIWTWLLGKTLFIL